MFQAGVKRHRMHSALLLVGPNKHDLPCMHESSSTSKCQNWALLSAEGREKIALLYKEYVFDYHDSAYKCSHCDVATTVGIIVVFLQQVYLVNKSELPITR